MGQKGGVVSSKELGSEPTLLKRPESMAGWVVWGGGCLQNRETASLQKCTSANERISSHARFYLKGNHPSSKLFFIFSLSITPSS
eukprot:751158-Hanusia_phi.AAC.2